jgi:hypothetical protein
MVLLAMPMPTYSQNQHDSPGYDRGITSAFLVTRFGARCDGIQMTLERSRPSSTRQVPDVPPDGAIWTVGIKRCSFPTRCRLNSGLIDSRSDCVGISSYAGGTLDFSSLPHGQTALTLKPLIYGAYTGNVARFENIQMIGPGRASDTIAIASSTPQTTYRQYNIHGFGHGLKFTAVPGSIIL